MRLRFRRLTIGLMMLAVAVLAVASAVALPRLRPPPPPGPPWLYYIEVFRRDPDGSIKIVYSKGYRYDTLPEESDGLSKVGSFRRRGSSFPGYVGSLRQTIADAEAAKLEYRITIPRGFTTDERPIY